MTCPFDNFDRFEWEFDNELLSDNQTTKIEMENITIAYMGI